MSSRTQTGALTIRNQEETPVVVQADVVLWAQADGQVMFIFILSVAAAEVSVGLALLLLLHRRFQTLDADAVSKMRG